MIEFCNIRMGCCFETGMQKLCFNAESAKNAKHFLCALCVKKILWGATGQIHPSKSEKTKKSLNRDLHD
jgi:hypothetical protein